MSNIEDYLVLESSLTAHICAQVFKDLEKTHTDIEKLIKAGDFVSAVRLAEEFKITPSKKVKNQAFLLSKSSILFGAGRITDSNSGLSLKLPDTEKALINSVRLLTNSIEVSIAKGIRNTLLTSIREVLASDPNVTVHKDDNPGRYLKKFVSFKDTASKAEAHAQLVSNLHTSRLSAYGYCIEAGVTGVGTYAINAQLDGKVCPVCRVMHGKTFKVADAKAQLELEFSAESAEDLKSLHPWPSQKEEDVKEFASLSPAELVAKGWSVPSYHPSCRCLLVLPKDVPFIENTPSYQEALYEDPSVAIYKPNKWDFITLGLPGDDETLTEWSKKLNKSPRQLLGELFGIEPNLVSKELLAEKGIMLSLSDGELSVSVKGDWKSLKDVTATASLALGSGVFKYSGMEVQANADLKKALKEQVSTLLDSGVSTLEMPLTTSVDAYYWSRYGWMPKVSDWEVVQGGVISNLEKLKDIIPSNDYLAIMNLVLTPDPKIMLAIANLKAVVSGVPLGKILTSNLIYTAVLDPKDIVAMQNFKHYFN